MSQSAITPKMMRRGREKLGRSGCGIWWIVLPSVKCVKNIACDAVLLGILDESRVP